MALLVFFWLIARVALALPGETEVVVAAPLPATADCVKNILTARGESILKVDTQQGVVMTGFRQVEPEALKRIAATDLGRGHIRWTKGMYQLTLTLSPADEGGTRIRAGARVFGYGETPLPLMRPSPWWPLPSTGSLERDLLGAVTAACRGNS